MHPTTSWRCAGSGRSEAAQHPHQRVSQHANDFVMKAIIMISTPDAIYIVQTNVPNHEPVPRNEYFVWGQRMARDFAVVVK